MHGRDSGTCIRLACIFDIIRTRVRGSTANCKSFLSFCFQALKEGRQPDYSDYKDFKLTCENIGYQMMLKLGWKEGEGLGTEGQGITQPVNK